MCEPTTIAAVTMAIVAAGSAYTGYEGSKAQAKTQSSLFEQNRKNSLAAMRDNYLTIQQRQSQEAAAAGQQIQERRLEAARQMATTRVASGEAGISGLSVERVMRDISGVASKDVSTIEQNRDWNLDQLGRQMAGIDTQTNSRINSVTRGTHPDPWGYGLEAANGIANAYMTGSSGGKK